MSKYQQQIEAFGKKLDLSVKVATRQVALMLHDRVVMRTPVDTGRARASWNIVEGTAADLSVADESFSGGEGGGAAVARGKQENLSDANSYVISNNLPYIVRLENGHSQQAPAGMVLLAVEETKMLIEAHTK